jgi:hypothetical protein
LDPWSIALSAFVFVGATPYEETQIVPTIRHPDW